jgi:hypothetical protein
VETPALVVDDHDLTTLVSFSFTMLKLRLEVQQCRKTIRDDVGFAVREANGGLG